MKNKKNYNMKITIKNYRINSNANYEFNERSINIEILILSKVFDRCICIIDVDEPNLVVKFKIGKLTKLKSKECEILKGKKKITNKQYKKLKNYALWFLNKLIPILMLEILRLPFWHK